MLCSQIYLCKFQLKNSDFHGSCRFFEFPAAGVLHNLSLQLPELKNGVFTMRDRSKNRKPLQKGRNLSIEGIQTVQALKRAKNDDNSLDRVFESRVRRLIKSDLIAVLRELQRQNEDRLALQVFEDVRKEYWYKPQVSLYADMIAVLARNGKFEKIDWLFSEMKTEIFEAGTEEFNALLRTLIENGICRAAIECYHLMKEIGCDPDKSTFRIMINGLESRGELGHSTAIWQEAEKYYGGSLDFLDEQEERS